ASSPIGGMSTSSTNDLTIALNATPTTMPTAMSTTLPRSAKSRNSFNTEGMVCPRFSSAAPVRSDPRQGDDNIHDPRDAAPEDVESGQQLDAVAHADPSVAVVNELAPEQDPARAAPVAGERTHRLRRRLCRLHVDGGYVAT